MVCPEPTVGSRASPCLSLDSHHLYLMVEKLFRLRGQLHAFEAGLHHLRCACFGKLLKRWAQVFSYVKEMIMVPTFQRCCEY